MADAEDFELRNYDLASNKNKLDNANTYLKSFKNPEKYFDSDKPIQAICYLRNLLGSNFYSKSEKAFEYFVKNDYSQLLADLVNYLAGNCEKFYPLNHPKNKDKENRQVKALDSSLYIINSLATNSHAFRLEFFQKGGLKGLLKMLDSDTFVHNFRNESYFAVIIMDVNWLSKDAEIFKIEWLELNAIDIILKTANLNIHCKRPAYMAFSNLANDKQIQTLPDISSIVVDFVNLIKKAATNMESTNKIQRTVQHYLDDDDPTISVEYEVYYIHDDISVHTTVSLTGVLMALYKLSINDTIKYDLYEKYGLKDPLKVIILKGSVIEQKHAIQVLAQLCFDKNVVDIVKQDDVVIKFIENLSKTNENVIKSIKRLCNDILWALKHTGVENMSQLPDKGLTRQIMISYNSGSRELCLKIKNELEKANFKVWIDVNEIHGSSLEAMARAVESSDIILMCVTEKYRQSINCQAEAQYAFKLKKKIIPVIMQKGYENLDGWLGIIMGDKIFINFMKYGFEECMKRLLNEVSLSHSHELAIRQSVSLQTTKQENNTTTQQDHPIKWDESQIKQWFIENKVNNAILENILPCNGELLNQLYKMKCNAPEFYYQSIGNNKTIDLKSILHFTLSLEKLFHNS